MFRLIGGALALAACSLSVLAGTPRTEEPSSSSTPMRFARFDEGPAESCGADCRVLVAAVGMISANTAKDFEAFAREHDVRGATVVLDSRGGSVHGAMAFGRLIRRLGLSTTIGRIKEIAPRGPGHRGVLSPRGDCPSMCPVVVLGGVRRYVPPESRVLVHQIWLGDRRDDAAAAQYTADDLVLVQRDIGRLVQYTSEMGGGTELIELALRIPPWEPMRALSRDELRRARLDTAPGTISQVESPATTAAASTSVGSRGDASERGWTLAERAGHAALVRRHPLTLEGERIGTFEIAVACSVDPNRLDITYSETRSGAGDRATLREVEVRVEGQTFPLDIMSSRPKNASGALQSVASGNLPAAAVQSFAGAEAGPLTVATTSSFNPATVTRVGGTGLAANFARLEAACMGAAARQTSARAELAGNDR